MQPVVRITKWKVSPMYDVCTVRFSPRHTFCNLGTLELAHISATAHLSMVLYANTQSGLVNRSIMYIDQT